MISKVQGLIIIILDMLDTVSTIKIGKCLRYGC